MWRETNLFGVYMSPLIVYALVALLLWLPLRYAMFRLGMHRMLYNPAMAATRHLFMPARSLGHLALIGSTRRNPR